MTRDQSSVECPPNFCPNGDWYSVPKEPLKIARQFTAGSGAGARQVPKGTAEKDSQFSRPIRDSYRCRSVPGVKTPGYCRKSLRDWIIKRCTLLKNSDESPFHSSSVPIRVHLWLNPAIRIKFALPLAGKTLASPFPPR